MKEPHKQLLCSYPNNAEPQLKLFRSASHFSPRPNEATQNAIRATFLTCRVYAIAFDDLSVTGSVNQNFHFRIDNVLVVKSIMLAWYSFVSG